MSPWIAQKDAVKWAIENLSRGNAKAVIDSLGWGSAEIERFRREEGLAKHPLDYATDENEPRAIPWKETRAEPTGS